MSLHIHAKTEDAGRGRIKNENLAILHRSHSGEMNVCERKVQILQRLGQHFLSIVTEHMKDRHGGWAGDRDDAGLGDGEVETLRRDGPRTRV